MGTAGICTNDGRCSEEPLVLQTMEVFDENTGRYGKIAHRKCSAYLGFNAFITFAPSFLCWIGGIPLLYQKAVYAT